MSVRPIRLVLALVLLGGCAAITSSRPLDTYELSGLSSTTAAAQGSRHLVVDPPTASGALTTERIAIKPNDYAVSYLPRARWADPAPDHVQLLIARSLTASGGFALVSTGGARPDPDWRLSTDLQAFQVELDAGGAPRVVVRLRATLISDEDRRIRGARTFEAAVPAAGTETADIVPAFDRALDTVLRDLTIWTLGRARGQV